MSEHRNDNLGVSFKLPEPITVRMHLRYVSATSQGQSVFESLWAGALELIQDWQCAALPDLKAFSLDQASAPDVVRIVAWTGAEVSRVVARLTDIPKA